MKYAFSFLVKEIVFPALILEMRFFFLISEKLGGKNYKKQHMLSFPSTTAFVFSVSSKET